MQPRKPATITSYSNGALVVLAPRERVRAQVGGGRRGSVTGFSKHSRRRLLRLLGTVDQTAPLPLFVTLTYPAEYPTARESKRTLDRFLKRLRRSYPKAAGVWKLERQQRGAPHYHLLIWNVRFLPNEIIARMWYDVVGSGDEKHYFAGTQVKRAKTYRGVWSYASKYLAKPQDVTSDDNWQQPGRFWAVFNRDCLPVSETYEFALTERAFFSLRRNMWRKMQRRQPHASINRVYMFAADTCQWSAAALRYSRNC